MFWYVYKHINATGALALTLKHFANQKATGIVVLMIN